MADVLAEGTGYRSGRDEEMLDGEAWFLSGLIRHVGYDQRPYIRETMHSALNL